MARFPDGFVFIVNAEPHFVDGKVEVDISIDEQELVMCENCKCYNRKTGYCYSTGCRRDTYFYCADGEKRSEAYDRD